MEPITERLRMLHQNSGIQGASLVARRQPTSSASANRRRQSISPATLSASDVDVDFNVLNGLSAVLNFVEAACTELESGAKPVIAVPCLRLSLDLLKRAYNELDKSDTAHVGAMGDIRAARAGASGGRDAATACVGDAERHSAHYARFDGCHADRARVTTQTRGFRRGHLGGWLSRHPHTPARRHRNGVTHGNAWQTRDRRFLARADTNRRIAFAD